MPAPAAISNRTVSSFVRGTTMQSILGIDQGALDQVMATAYLLYQSGRYAEVDVLCRGLIAADHTYWWSYSLHAATLRRMGRLAEALEQIDNGLAHEPGEKKLQLMRGEILAAIGSWKDRAASEDGSNEATSLSPSPVPPAAPGDAASHASTTAAEVEP
jgi:predicted Zn-dependent protease